MNTELWSTLFLSLVHISTAWYPSWLTRKEGCPVMTQCFNPCFYGYVDTVDSNGCTYRNCECRDACELMRCGEGNRCVSKKRCLFGNYFCFDLAVCEVESDPKEFVAECPLGDKPLANVFCGHGPGSTHCPITHECIIDELDRYTGCCQTKTELLPRCEQPKYVGNCKAKLPRYYYDNAAGRCLSFDYGGCGGNKNRFTTSYDCETACGGDVCQKPKVIGRCRAAIPRYYHNSTLKRCEPFTYGGCDANGNNFHTYDQCQRKCEFI